MKILSELRDDSKTNNQLNLFGRTFVTIYLQTLCVCGGEFFSKHFVRKVENLWSLLVDAGFKSFNSN